jgi:hypothetical protein
LNTSKRKDKNMKEILGILIGINAAIWLVVAIISAQM